MSQKYYGVIYKITNKVNGKIYIGQAVNFTKRKREHLYRARHTNVNFKIYNAIRKYGEENFDWDVIDYARDEKDLNEKEGFWINHHRSFIDFINSNGYNMTLGGDCNSLSKETRDKISNSRIGKDNPQSKSVIQLNFKGEIINRYDTLKNGADSVNGDSSVISKCCKGVKISHKNYLWMYESDYNEDSLLALLDSLWKDAVVKLSEENEFISVYINAKEGAKSIDGDNSCVLKCCKGVYKMYKGFKWMYYREYKLLD